MMLLLVSETRDVVISSKLQAKKLTTNAVTVSRCYFTSSDRLWLLWTVDQEVMKYYSDHHASSDYIYTVKFL
jgi:hypothetical protein